MSWTVIGTLTLVYWILLFVRMRARGRRELEHAVDQASRGRAPGESFDVVVSTDVRPLRVAAIVMAVPIALLVIHFFAAAL